MDLYVISRDFPFVFIIIMMIDCSGKHRTESTFRPTNNADGA